MRWIVLGEKNGKIALVSKSSVTGLLPKGSYLTIEGDETQFILRVDDSQQVESYSPSPMIVDMELEPLQADQKCQNIIAAFRVMDITSRKDGLIDYIKPQSIARRSTQEEIELALAGNRGGPRVFLATAHASQNQLLTDEEGNFITTQLPEDMFYHQILVCGRTGLGKTVATKYLAQYFVEKLEGAVLAINVKDVDFLKMDQASTEKTPQIEKEWAVLNEGARGIDNFMVYYPANTEIPVNQGVTLEISQRITLNVHDIDPEALTGLLQGISDVAAQNLPNIFRHWQEEQKARNPEGFTFGEFVSYFARAEDDDRVFPTLNSRGDASEIRLHPGTFQNIRRNLDVASDFFDNEDALSLDESHILVPGKMSVINVSGDKGIQFGSILLRHLLHKMVAAKSEGTYVVPILIIIDEVHQFYDTNSSAEALGDLARICRTGRSQEIGVVFSSQNPGDIPRGLSTVINTKIFLKSDAGLARSYGVIISAEEMENLKPGFAAVSIYDMSQLKIVKFPLAFAGVHKKKGKQNER